MKFILNKKTITNISTINGLFLLTKKINKEYFDITNNKVSIENTKSICFIKDKLTLLESNFLLKEEKEQEIDILNEFKKNNLYINYSDNIALLKSSYNNEDIYLFEFNNKNNNLYTVVQKYLNTNISHDSEIYKNIINNVTDTIINIPLIIEINELLFNEKHIPNDLCRVKEQAYNLLTKSNKKNSNLELMKIRNKIENEETKELHDVFLKISKLMNINLDEFKNISTKYNKTNHSNTNNN